MHCVLSWGQECDRISVTLSTQTEIDQFSMSHAGCTTIGQLNLNFDETDPIENLRGLSQLKKVTNGVIISRQKHLASLKGLDSLTSAGSLFIEYNDRLENLTGLEKIESANFLTIRDNPMLLNISGLSSIIYGGQVRIADNDTLSSLDGLNNLEAAACITLERNKNLTQIEALSKLRTLSCGIRITDNPSLLSLQGLQNIDEFIANSSVVIDNNDRLINLEGLNKIPRSSTLTITNNDQLISLEGIDSIRELIHFSCDRNKSLKNLKGIEQIRKIQFLSIDDNDSLENLHGLDGLEEVNDFSLIRNEKMESLEGLEQLKIITKDLRIALNPSLINIDELESLTRIDGKLSISDNSSLKNIDGLMSLCTPPVSSGIRDNNSLSSVNLSPKLTSMTFLVIEECNALQNVDGLRHIDTIVGGLWLVDNDSLNQLQGLSNIRYIDGSFILESLPMLSDLEGLSNLENVEDNFNIWYNDSISSLEGLENIESLSGSLSLVGLGGINNLDGLQNLHRVNGPLTISGCDGLVNLEGIDSIEAVGGLTISRNNSLEEIETLRNVKEFSGKLSIRLNQKLTSLFGTFSFDHTNISSIEIEFNRKLGICNNQSICDFIYEGGDATITGNARRCREYDDVYNNCPFSSKLQLITYHDENEDQKLSEGENLFYNFVLDVVPDSFSIYPNSDQNGLYFIEPGEHTFSVDLSYDSCWSLTNDEFEVSLETFDRTCDTLVLGFKPLVQKRSMRSSMNIDRLRCNDISRLDIEIYNDGTEMNSGIVNLELDDLIRDYVPFDFPVTVIDSSIISWNYDSIYPSFSKRYSLFILGPSEIFTGDTVSFRVSTTIDNHEGIDTSEYFTEVRCSFDPNDKLVSKTDIIDTDLTNAIIDYTVRFQNTGNDIAYDIEIRDTLDEQLDMSRFRFVSSSHPEVLTTKLNTDGTLSFLFKNIFLPDSTSNEPGSHGYVSYSIAPYPYLTVGSRIVNQASIYFDFNPPIVTNSVSTDIVEISDEVDLAELLDIKAYLEGPYIEAGMMATDLFDLQYLPGQIPITFLGTPGDPQLYNREPWNYPYSLTLLDYANQEGAVDFVLISIYENELLGTPICRTAGLVYSDGNVSIKPESSCPLEADSSYFVLLEHRNHLPVLYPETILCCNNDTRLDFTNKDSYRGLLSSGQKEVETGIYAMYAGNANQNGIDRVDLNFGDKSEFLKELGQNSSYYIGDFDMNGDVNFKDLGFLLSNIGVFSGIRF